MYSLGVSGETECSRASAVRVKRRRQRGPWMRCRRGRIRRGRVGWLLDVEEEDVRVLVVEEPERDR
jgi:hypothetical protein